MRGIEQRVLVGQNRLEGPGHDALVVELLGRDRIDEREAVAFGDHAADRRGELRVDDRAPHDPGVLEDRVDPGPRADLLAQGDEALALEIAGLKDGLALEAVALGHDRDKGRLEQEVLGDRGVALLDRGKTHVELLARDPFHDLGRAAGLERDVDLGMRLGKPPDHLGQEAERHGRQGGHAQRPDIEHADVLGRAQDLLEPDEGALDLVVEDLRLDRRTQPAAVALEEGEADGVLQVLDQAGHGGLGDQQALGRAGHRAGVHHGLEGLELTVVDAPSHARLLASRHLRQRGVEAMAPVKPRPRPG